MQSSASIESYCILAHSSRSHPSVLEVYEKELVLETASIANTSVNASNSEESVVRRYPLSTVLSPMHDINAFILHPLYDALSRKQNISLLFASAPPPTAAALENQQSLYTTPTSSATPAAGITSGESISIHLQLLSGLLPSLLNRAHVASNGKAGKVCTATVFEVAVPPNAASSGSNGAVSALVARDLLFSSNPNHHHANQLPYSIVSSLSALSELQFSFSAAGGNEACESFWGEVMDVIRLERLASSSRNASRNSANYQEARANLTRTDRTLSDPARTALFVCVRIDHWSSILIGDLGSNPQLLHLCSLALQQDDGLFGVGTSLKPPRNSMLTEILTPFCTPLPPTGVMPSQFRMIAAASEHGYCCRVVSVPNLVTRIPESVRQLHFVSTLVSSQKKESIDLLVREEEDGDGDGTRQPFSYHHRQLPAAMHKEGGDGAGGAFTNVVPLPSASSLQEILEGEHSSGYQQHFVPHRVPPPLLASAASARPVSMVVPAPSKGPPSSGRSTNGTQHFAFSVAQPSDEAMLAIAPNSGNLSASSVSAASVGRGGRTMVDDWRSELLVDYRLEDERRRSNAIRMGVGADMNGTEPLHSTDTKQEAHARSSELERLASGSPPREATLNYSSAVTSPTLEAFGRASHRGDSGALPPQPRLAGEPQRVAPPPPSLPNQQPANNASTRTSSHSAVKLGYSDQYARRRSSSPVMSDSSQFTNAAAMHRENEVRLGINATPRATVGPLPPPPPQQVVVPRSVPRSRVEMRSQWQVVEEDEPPQQQQGVAAAEAIADARLRDAHQQLSASAAVNNDLQQVIRQLKTQLQCTAQRLDANGTSRAAGGEAEEVDAGRGRLRSPSPSLQRGAASSASAATPTQGRRRANSIPSKGSCAVSGSAATSTKRPHTMVAAPHPNPHDENAPALVDLTGVIDKLYQRIGDMEILYDRDVKVLRSLEKENAQLVKENALLAEKDKKVEKLLKEMQKKETIRIRQNALDRLYKVAGHATGGGTAAAGVSADGEDHLDPNAKPSALFNAKAVALREKLVKEQESELKILRRKLTNLEAENGKLRRKCGLPVVDQGASLIQGKPLAGPNAVNKAAAAAASDSGKSTASFPPPQQLLAGSEHNGPLFEAITHNLGVQSDEGSRISAFIEAERAAMLADISKAHEELAVVKRQRDDLQRMLKAGPSTPTAADHVQAVSASLLDGCQTMLARLNAAEARLKEREFVSKLSSTPKSVRSHNTSRADGDDDGGASGCSPALLSIAQHRDAVNRLVASVSDVLQRTCSGANAGVATQGLLPTNVDDAEVLNYYLSFEVERLQALKSFVPMYTQLSAGVDQLKRYA